MKRGQSAVRGVVCTAAGGISWGISGACSQYLFMRGSVDPVWLTTARMLSAGIILLFASLPRGQHEMSGILKDKKDVLQLFAFGVAGLLLCQFAYLSAIRSSNSGTATVLQSLSVVMLAVYVSFKSRSLPSKKQMLSIVLALAGVYLIATNGKPNGLIISPGGLLWGLGAALGAVSYSLLSQRIVAKWGSRIVTGFGMLIGGSALLIAARAWNIPAVLDFSAVIAVAVIVLVGTVGAFTLFIQGLSDLGPVKATLIACLEPVTATAVSAVWLRTSFSTADIIGFGCILVTVFLSVGEA